MFRQISKIITKLSDFTNSLQFIDNPMTLFNIIDDKGEYVFMDLFMVLQLLCGLALFLFGMNSMGDGLESLSGGNLKKLWKK